MAKDTLYGIMTLFETSFGNVPSGNGRMAYFKDWIDQTAELGAQVIRLPGDWRMLEENGDDKWAQWYVDETVQLIKYAGQKGIQVIYEFAQTPDWAKSTNSSDVWTYPSSAKQFGEAAAYLHQAFIDAGVSKYVAAWEIWNEPNVKAFWPGGAYRNPGSAADGTDISVNKAAAGEYVKLLNAAYDALKAVDGNVTVLGGSLAGTDFEYAEWMLQKGAKFDALSVHPYTRPFEPNSPTPGRPNEDPTIHPELGYQSNTLNERWSFEYGIETIHDLLKSYGKSGDIWLTEMGWRLPSHASWNYVPGQQAQANYLQSALELIKDWDFLKAVTIFNLYDSYDGDFGLLQPNGKWRAAAQVFHDFVTGTGGSNNNNNNNTGGGASIFHLDGTNGDDSLIGKLNRINDINGRGGDDYIEAGNKDDVIAGGRGDDVIITGKSANVVNGGRGEDTLVFLHANADFTISERKGHLLLENGKTSAAIHNIEWIVFDAKNGNFSINAKELLGHRHDISGSAVDDNLSGTAGSQFLYGRAGNDMINGGRGGDIMFGGRGGDIYTVDNIHDMVIEKAGHGTDDVISSVSYSLKFLTNVENLALSGLNAKNATGNANNNILAGNNADNVIRGLGGDDVINGGLGDDTLYGGAGADLFIFQHNSGHDRIVDFSADAGDVIDLSNVGDITDFGDLSVNHLSYSGSSAVISVGGAFSITIDGLDAGQPLSSDAFIFG